MNHWLPLALAALVIGCLAVLAAIAVHLVNGSVPRTIAVLIPGAMLIVLGLVVLRYRGR